MDADGNITQDSIKSIDDSAQNQEPAAPGTEENGELPKKQSDDQDVDKVATNDDQKLDEHRESDRHEHRSRRGSRHLSDRHSTKDRSPHRHDSASRHRRGTSRGSRTSGHHNKDILSFQQIKVRTCCLLTM